MSPNTGSFGPQGDGGRLGSKLVIPCATCLVAACQDGAAGPVRQHQVAVAAHDLQEEA